jgi:hypothetical protein
MFIRAFDDIPGSDATLAGASRRATRAPADGGIRGGGIIKFTVLLMFDFTI